MLPESDQRKLLAQIDDLLGSTQKDISLVLHLQPTNATEQLEIFLAKGGKYNPQFTYAFPAKSSLTGLLNTLHNIKHSHIDTQDYTLPCAKLFADKLQERIRETELMVAYVDQDFSAIKGLNTLLYGTFDPALVKESEDVLLHYQEPSAQTRGKKLSTSEIVHTIESYLAEHAIKDIVLQPLTYCPMKFMLSYKKNGSCVLNFSETLSTREHLLTGNLIHELGVHYQRHSNGKKTGRNLLQYGTAGHHADEEGLANYQASSYMQTIFPSFRKKTIYEKYHALAHADGKSFTELYDYFLHYFPSISLSAAFNKISRLFMGIQDTSVQEDGILFFYNKTYLDGFSKIQKRHQAGNDLNLLFTGKIKIEDIKFLGQMPAKGRLS